MCLFFLFWCNSAISQNLDDDTSRIKLSVEYKSKQDTYKNTDNNPSSGEGMYIREPYKNFSFLLGVRLHPNIIAEVGFQREEFQIGWELTEKHPFSSYRSFESAYVIPLRLYYKIKLFNLFKNPVSISPSLGYLMAFGQGGKAILGDGIGTITFTDMGFTFVATDRHFKGVEYALEKNYGFGEIRLQLEFNISKAFSFYGGGGYCFGTKVIGKTNVSYSINGMPAQQISTASKGSNRYLNAGIKLRIPNSKKK